MFSGYDNTYNLNKKYIRSFTYRFDELKQNILKDNNFPNWLYTGKVYRIHRCPILTKSGKIKVSKNRIKPTKNNYTHWSKNPEIYNYMFSDLSGYHCCVHEPFLLIEGKVKNGLNKNEIFKECYVNYPSPETERFFKEEEIVAPMNNENIEKVFLVYDRNDKNKWVDVTDLLLKKH